MLLLYCFVLSWLAMLTLAMKRRKKKKKKKMRVVGVKLKVTALETGKELRKQTKLLEVATEPAVKSSEPR